MSSAFVSPLVFLKAGGATKPLKDLTQEEIDTAWKNFYKVSPSWGKMKMLFNREEQIDKNSYVHSMRSFMQFGFPIKVKDPEDEKKTIRYKNMLDRKTD